MTRSMPALALIVFVALAAAVLSAASWLMAQGFDQRPAIASTPLQPPISNPQSTPRPVSQSLLSQATNLPTIPPWPTMQSTPTPLPNLQSQISNLPVSPPLEPPQHVALNGIPWESIVVMPPEVVGRAREIFAAGQALGRDPHAYSKVGDSTIEYPHFMARFDEGPYDLGPYAYLQPIIDQFRGSHNRDSLAVRIGLHSWAANDPMWAEPGLCLADETPVQCEIRAHNPSILLIVLGANDVGAPGMFEDNMRRIVDTAIAAGVVPVLGTKGDRNEGSNENNDILRRIAADYSIPLWDYDRVADTLPGRGLDEDGVHMLTFYAHDYNDPSAFSRGHAMHNLTALMVLDAVWRLVE